MADDDVMTVDLFVRSYYKDFRWLDYCLQSIERFCRDFRQVIVVVPRASHARLPRTRLGLARVEICPDYADDYLGQQVTKIHADTFTDADYVCHVDSDCVFRRSVELADLFENGKPQILMTRYALLPPHAPWQSLTEKFLQRKVTYDFMRRQPLLFPRWLYGDLRAHARELHGIDIESYIRSQPPRGFTEYNALGAYAFGHHRHRFAWTESTSRAYDESFCRWFWSWGGIRPSIRREIETLIA